MKLRRDIQIHTCFRNLTLVTNPLIRCICRVGWGILYFTPDSRVQFVNLNAFSNNSIVHLLARLILLTYLYTIYGKINKKPERKK